MTFFSTGSKISGLFTTTKLDMSLTPAHIDFCIFVNGNYFIIFTHIWVIYTIITCKSIVNPNTKYFIFLENSFLTNLTSSWPSNDISSICLILNSRLSNKVMLTFFMNNINFAITIIV